MQIIVLDEWTSGKFYSIEFAGSWNFFGSSNIEGLEIDLKIKVSSQINISNHFVILFDCFRFERAHIHIELISLDNLTHAHTQKHGGVRPWERIYKLNWINSKDRFILQNILLAGNVHFSIELDWKTCLRRNIFHLRIDHPNLFYSIFNMLRFQLKLSI